MLIWIDEFPGGVNKSFASLQDHPLRGNQWIHHSVYVETVKTSTSASSSLISLQYIF